jgi:hypothetical protein
MINIPFTITASVLFVLATANFGSAQTIHVKVNGRTIVGKPVVWNDHTVKVMERDGAISHLAPQQATDYKLLSDDFSLFSRGEMFRQLKREFTGYEVSATTQYLIVHPRGQKQLWSTRFEEIYRSVLHYFSVRGINAHQSALPFVAIVFRNESEYLRHISTNAQFNASGTLGMYLESTNRIYLFDATEGRANGSEGYEDWAVNANTIIHEAAHQAAFNTGVQRRYGAGPAWVSEGIGTLFEARGVWNGFKHRLLSDRVNDHRLRQFQRTVNELNFSETVKQMISSDRLTDANPPQGYGTAWAMTFFATERRQQQYAAYLKKLFSRDPFNHYTTSQRISDFRDCFGNVDKFIQDMQNFYRNL